MCVVIAVYNPNFVYLSKELHSIMDQSYTNWECVLVVDNLEKIPELDLLALQDERIKVFYGENLGVYHNFERGLQIGLQSKADLFCFADQDDLWDLEKLDVIVDLFIQRKFELFHSDLKAIDQSDGVLSDSVWRKEKRNLKANFRNLLVRNCVTGCTMAITRELALLSLPFPSQRDNTYWHHDLWISLIQSTVNKKGIYFHHNQLVSYRQHSANIIGMQNQVYFPKTFNQAIVDYRIRRTLSKEVLKRTKGRQKNSKLLTRIGSSPFAPFIFFTPLDVLRNENRVAIKLHLFLFLGGLLSIVHSAYVRIQASTHKVKRSLLIRLFNAAKKHFISYTSSSSPELRSLTNFGPRFSIALTNKVTRSPKIIVILPAIRESSLFGGSATLLRMAFEFQTLTQRPILLVSSDAAPDLSPDDLMKRFVLQPSHFNRGLMMVKDADAILVDKNDYIFVSAWWNFAGIKKKINGDFSAVKLVYLIQDFEPGFYPWSSNFAAAESTYDYEPEIEYIFNTKILKEYFVNQLDPRYGNSPAIHPLLGDFINKTRCIDNKKSLRVFFYARPSVNRNLFELGMETLVKFSNEMSDMGIDVEICPAGEVIHTQVLEKYTSLKFDTQSIEKLSEMQYQRLLLSCHIGLSLMLSPHPSYPPLEGALSGMWVVTNSFANKSQEAFKKSLIMKSPTSVDLASGLLEAYKRTLAGTVPEILITSFGDNPALVLESMSLE